MNTSEQFFIGKLNKGILILNQRTGTLFNNVTKHYVATSLHS